MKEGFETRTAEEIAWEMFEKTGNISYYMLYHELKRKK
ncbi:MAG: YqzL family protein [Clostridia bacterium]|nr:YqzL family protein [Clostridia bacterium]